MNTPILLAFLALVTGGLLRFSWKFGAANQSYGPSFFLAQVIGISLVLIVAHIVQRHPFELSAKMTGVAILSGIVATIGTLGLYLAFRMGGEGSVLFPIVSLGVIVSVPLSIIVFREPITATKLLGFGFGITSIIFLSR